MRLKRGDGPKRDEYGVTFGDVHAGGGVWVHLRSRWLRLGFNVRKNLATLHLSTLTIARWWPF